MTPRPASFDTPNRPRRASVLLLLALVGSLLSIPTAARAVTPTVTIDAPPVDGDDGWHRATPAFTLDAGDAADGIQRIDHEFSGMSEGGGAWTSSGTFSYPPPYPLSVTESLTANTTGDQTLLVTAVDGTGATASASHAFKWDPEVPSQPTNPRWLDSTGALVESVSPDEQICARWDASTDVVSGLKTYHVQVAESPEFTTPIVDRTTGSTSTNACFGSSDGIRSGRSYYFRVLGRDHAGNESTWSSPSNRVDVTDQSTGPALIHAPVTSGYFGEPIPISLTASCEGDGPCSARLFYRTTPNTGTAGLLGDGWTRVDLAEGAATTIAGRSAVEWSGSVPGAAATSQGVDYFVEAEDTFALTQMPGATFVGSDEATGIQPAAHSFFHVAVVSPPLLAHTPPPFARDGEPVPLELSATCSSGACEATLYYRTSTGSLADDTLVAAPDWPRVTMTSEGEPTSLGEAGAVFGFRGEIPANAVDTRGVDYVFSVTDGSTTTWWPGTPPQGYYASLDGMRTGYHHLHVLETPHVVHVPVVASPYREPIAIAAQANCTSGSCSGTLYYRTTVSDVLDAGPAFDTTPMTATVVGSQDGVDVVEVRGDIPASVADTRGVDYFFSVTDGATTTWWPGTSSVDGYQPVDGTRVGYHHTRIVEPPHLAHVPVPVSDAFTDFVVETELTCVTETCSASLHYTSDPSAGAAAYQSLPMTRVSDETETPAGRVATYRATIPAPDVTTRGLAYRLEAFDGYVRTFSPGGSYWGAYVPDEGRPPQQDATVGQHSVATYAYPVHVLEPPHVVHAPELVSYYGEPVDIEAHSNCATASCEATLHWRTTGHPWQSAAMTVETAAAVDPAELWTYRAVIPAGDVTTEGVDYWIEVTDGFAQDSTPTYHTTVLAPTAIVHAPILTAFPGEPLDVEALVPCSTANCSVTLSYRTPEEGALSEPAWTEAVMTPVGAATAAGEAAVVQRYHATIPADAVTTRGVDYFIHSYDGHTNAYSPGTAYVATQFAHADGARTHYFHVHVAEPVRLVHEPVVVAEWKEPIEITARANCATGSCAATLSYRSSAGMDDATGVVAYLDAPFTDVAMDQQAVADLGDGGQVLELSAQIPAEVVTTEGVDYFLHVTDGDTNAYYPGTTYVAGAGSLDGTRAAWQHVEVLLRAPVRAITHAPPAAAQFREHVPLRFAATCTADADCDATVWFRTTPNEADSNVLLTGEPDWATATVTEIAARPQRTGFVAHVFEATIPAEHVDTRGVDYLLKVSDGEHTSYWPPVTAQFDASAEVNGITIDGSSGVFVAHHLHVLGPPAIVHAPPASAPAAQPAALRWHVVCSADFVEQCDTEAHRVDATGSSHPLVTTVTEVDRRGGQIVVEATASLPASPVATVDEYFLWATDGNTNTYSPGTPYLSGPLTLDGTRTGTYAVYRYLV